MSTPNKTCTVCGALVSDQFARHWPPDDEYLWNPTFKPLPRPKGLRHCDGRRRDA